MLQNNLIPQYCPSCSSTLTIDGIHLVCNNPNCSEKNIQIITSWVQGCQMDGISESTIRLLYENGLIRSIEDLYDLKNKASAIKIIPGMGDKKVANLINQIEKSKTITIIQFLARLSIDLIGEKAVTKLGIKTIDDFWNFKDSTYVIGKNLIEYRNAHTTELVRLVDILDIQSIEDKKQTLGNIAMTGSGPKSRSELIKDLNEKGYSFADTINKDTSILLTDDLNSNSSKIQKAKKLGIEIKTYTEFFK